MELEYGGLFLLGLLAMAFGLYYAKGYWWVVLLTAPGLIGTMMPEKESNATTAVYILIIVAYAIIIPVLTGSGFFYLLGNAIEARRPGGPPRRSIQSSILYHAPLLLGIAIAVLSVVRFVDLNGKEPKTRIAFAIGAAISLSYVIYRRMEADVHSEDAL